MRTNSSAITPPSKPEAPPMRGREPRPTIHEETNMSIKTRITELFGIEHPTIQGGLQYVGYADMTAAVSHAGGFGMRTGHTQGTPEILASEIDLDSAMTSTQISVSLTFPPSTRNRAGKGRSVVARIKPGCR